MSNPIPNLRQLQSCLHRIRSNGIVLHDRVRGDISKQVASNIISDAEVGLAALHAPIRDMCVEPLAPTDTPVDTATPAPAALDGQPDVAALVRLLLDLLNMVSCSTGQAESPALHAAISAAQTLAGQMGFTHTEQPGAQARPEPHDVDDVDGDDEAIDLAAIARDIDAGVGISTTGNRLADEDLLAAVQAAVAVEEIRETVVVGLQDVHRRIGHCHLLFDQIHEGAQRSSSPPGLGQFADIGRDIATEVQDECLSLLRLLEDAGKEENHG